MLLVTQRPILPYQTVWEEMRAFTQTRDSTTPDMCWFLEHFPVYTQGQAGLPEHLINPAHIEVVQSDRGGQITYHGPGQLVVYFLFDLQRRGIGIRTLVTALEDTLIELLATFNVIAHRVCGAPGVYVNDDKIASIGLRVSRGCTYHGIALNVRMDMTPFQGIRPCGLSVNMTQLVDFVENITMDDVSQKLQQMVLSRFGDTHV